MSAAPLLTILRDGEMVKSMSLEEDAILGRGEDCVIRLEDRAISRQHLIFKRNKEGVSVEKKSQFAPLKVNGAEVEQAQLGEGDVISIGPYLLRLSQMKGASAPSVPQVGMTPSQAAVLSLAHTATYEPPTVTEPMSAKEEVVTATAPMDAPVDSFSESAPVDLTSFVEHAPEETVKGVERAATSDTAELKAVTEESASEAAQFEHSFDAPLDLNGPPSNLETPQDLGMQELPQEQSQNQGIDAFQSSAEVAPNEESPSNLVDSNAFTNDEDAKTKLTSVSHVRAMLVFRDGAANVTEYEISKNEVSIGRSKSCDIVINDKKASRKHVIIQKLGNHFVIKDLETVNGTFLNGKKFTEQELSGQDLIKIGETEFQFQAENKDYAQKQEQFLQLPAEVPAEADGEMAMEESVPNAPLDFSSQPQAFQQGFGSAEATAQPGMMGIDPSITEPVDKSLLGRFKKDPKFRKKVIMYGAFLAVAYMLLVDEDPQPVKEAPKPKPSVVVNQIGNTYDSLSADKKKYVDTEYDLGYTSYQQRDYDKAIDSMMNVHKLIPEGYKQSKEIERYAREGQAKLRAIEEERKRKEEEEKRKARILELVEEGRGMMAKMQYEAVKPVMERILELDPENASVAQWKKEIEAYEEKLRTEENARRLAAEINKRAWDTFNEGMALKKREKFYGAIDVFKTIPDMRASDGRVTQRSIEQVKACKDEIKNRRDPFLVEAREKEEAGELTAAFKLFKKATIVDPPHPEGYKGMARIRQILNDRAKIIYTEAILAESYSDFTTAKKKYEEILRVAPEEDLYYGRAQRKLRMYINPNFTSGG